HPRHAAARDRARRRAVDRRARRSLRGPRAAADRGAVMISVLVVNDQEVVRIGLRALIDNTDDMDCVGEASDGDTAVSAARRLRPDVVLMDIRMPGVDGLEATKRISADGSLSDTKVLVLTTFDFDEYLFEALRHGASGFLAKNTKPAELLDASRVAAEGAALLSPARSDKGLRAQV